LGPRDTAGPADTIRSNSLFTTVNPRFAPAASALATALAMSTPTLLAQTPAGPRDRASIAAEYKWDYTPIYPSWEAWDAGMKTMELKMDAFEALKGTLKNGPAAVLKAYRAYDEIGKLQYLTYRYPQLQRDVDTRDQAVSGRFQRVGAMFAKFDAATAWFTPELLKVPEKTMRQWLAKEPALAPYRFPILDQYRRQAHVLDEAGERLLALAGPPTQQLNTAYQELSTSDIKFPTIKLSDGKEVTLSPSAYRALLDTDRNQAHRAQAAAAHVGTYAATANTYAALYRGVVERGWFNAQARKFPNTLEAALHDNAIPASVVTNLIETTRAGVAPLQRYARLRQRLLGLAEYHNYDSATPVIESKKTYPYPEARDLVQASVAPLGTEYTAKFKQFVAGGRIDVYETPGKKSGAYMANVYGVGPYQLMNYNDTLDSVFTLAHEAGHAMHSVLSNEAQPFVTSSYTIFVAEVASTTNERFLLEHMLARTSDPKERFALLEHAIEQIVGTYYTQAMFADFELQAHRLVEKGQPLTAEVLNKLYLDTFKAYFGAGMTIDDFYKVTWTRISHFFNTPYYVFQYATCFASSAQLFKAMTSGPEGQRKAATERYLTLLRSGGNDHPMAQLKKAGVDLTQRATIQAVIDQMDELVTRLEAEAGKLK
jgi:oligoendopeptidase F